MRQWLADADDPARIIVAGEGFELIDAHGRRYIDGFSSLWCNLHGHRVPKIDSAIRAQLRKIAHTTLLGHASVPSIELAERLVRISPAGLAKVFFSDSGAAAVEIALKMAFQYYRNIGQPERRRFIAMRESYHGDTIGAVSLGGIDTFRRVFAPLLFDTTFVQTPNARRHPARQGDAVASPDGERGAALRQGFDAELSRSAQGALRNPPRGSCSDSKGAAVLRQIDAELSAAAGEYCAVIVEPLIQGAAGMLTHPPGFLAALRELTHKHDVLLIADEVATGFCRTGRLFACEHEAVCPDIMCLGKGLTGGYLPVAATLTTQKIFDAFCDDVGEGATCPPETAGRRAFYHGHTYTGNALGCAAAAASIDLIFESKLLEALPEKAARIQKALSELARHRHVGDIRQCGMMVGIELVRDRERWTRLPAVSGGQERFDPSYRVGAAVCKAARGHGVITRPLGDVVVLMPAPGMDLDTLDRLLDAIVTTISQFKFPA
jgi:adenosylmethionine-8-amino-7-oxononanoate aminotransferase